MNLKKLISFSVIIITSITINTGCEKYIQEGIDIENITILKVVGIDKLGGEIKLTSVIKTPKSEQRGGIIEVEPEIFVSKGATVFQAVRELASYSTKKPFWGRVEQLIIGEQAAKTGLREIIDFFIRNNELRPNINIYLTKGQTAEEIIKTTATQKSFIGDTLRTLTQNRGELSMSTEIKLNEVAYILDSKTIAPYLPCLQLIEEVNQIGIKPSIPSLQLIGLGVFKDNHLLYYLDGNETRGFNWIKGDVRSGVINVKDHTGQNVSLEILDSTRKIKTNIENGIPSITVNIEMTSNLIEQWSPENIYTEEALNFLKTQQEEIIKTEVLNVIKKAQTMNTDIFEFGEIIYHQHPNKWKQIEDKWKALFPIAEIKVNVKSNINRTYVVGKPQQHKKKGKKE